MQARRGCTRDIDEFDFHGEKLKRCPRRPHLDMPEMIYEALHTHRWYRKGFLPAPGQWTDQTEAFVEFMERIDEAVSITEKVLQERQLNK